MPSPTSLIIWDWNGTLLDDISICLDSMNSMLALRRLPQLTADHYRSVFTFPVAQYYRSIGFDFDNESFDTVAMEFMDRYFSRLPAATLHEGAENLLEFIRSSDIRQCILSAMEHQALAESVKKLGIQKYFSRILGIDDHFAHGKSAIARRLLDEAGIPSGEVLLVGDTLHDHEIADDLGCHCVLIAHGHQSRERLIASGRQVFNDFSELKDYLQHLVH
jgi:phosphoglycolate phosphatase